MIVDAAGPERAVFAGDFDACVIGAGFAGITLARGLAAKGHRVALMEAGGREWSPESQDVYHGEIVGPALGLPLDASRLRFFGGTSYHWAGFCGEQEPHKFERRPNDPLSGWPIGLDDLKPYTAETHDILDLVPEYDTPAPAGAGPDDPFRPMAYHSSPPTRFAEKYEAAIAASGRIVLGLHANLVDLGLDDDLGRIERAVFRSFQADDPGFAVRARVFCLCAGGIENARLLLNFRDRIPVGIGNEHDLVGRYYSDTVSLEIGEMIFAALPAAQRQFFSPTEAFIVGQGSHDTMIRLTHRPGRTRLASLPREALRSAQCLPLVDRLAEAALGPRAASCDTGGLQAYWMARDPERYPWGDVQIHGSHALNPDSRVTLSEERDAFGLFRPRLDWQLRDSDRDSVRASAIAFAGYAADTGLGRMRLRDWVTADPPALPDVAAQPHLGTLTSAHHMCTTRMSADPRQGVVDPDCRLHGVENLYLGGSSVFAASAFPPTYTIVQLALRLADHLHSEPLKS